MGGIEGTAAGYGIWKVECLLLLVAQDQDPLFDLSLWPLSCRKDQGPNSIYLRTQ